MHVTAAKNALRITNESCAEMNKNKADGLSDSAETNVHTNAGGRKVLREVTVNVSINFYSLASNYRHSSIYYTNVNTTNKLIGFMIFFSFRQNNNIGVPAARCVNFNDHPVCNDNNGASNAFSLNLNSPPPLAYFE